LATLYLICGLPGSGKTTLAKQIEQDHAALRFAPDEWIMRLLPEGWDSAELDRLRTPVESIQWDTALRALKLGISVVLEWGFWSHEERAHYRELAYQVGARVETLYLEVPLEELWARLKRRNANLPPGTFVVSKAELEFWWTLLEPPSPEELALERQWTSTTV